MPTLSRIRKSIRNTRRPRRRKGPPKGHREEPGGTGKFERVRTTGQKRAHAHRIVGLMAKEGKARVAAQRAGGRQAAIHASSKLQSAAKTSGPPRKTHKERNPRFRI